MLQTCYNSDYMEEVTDFNNRTNCLFLKSNLRGNINISFEMLH
jgi:hypothetical protein